MRVSSLAEQVHALFSPRAFPAFALRRARAVPHGAAGRDSSLPPEARSRERVLTLTIALLACYAFGVILLQGSGTFASNALEGGIAITWAISILVTRPGSPPSPFGARPCRRSRAVKSAALATLPALALVVAAKAILAGTGRAESILQPSCATPWNGLVYVVLYPIYVFVQEYAFRGWLLGVLLESARGRLDRARAVLTASLVFGACHLHLSPAVAVLTFLAGNFWGALYLRYRTLAAPVISHILVGYAFAAVGGWALVGGVPDRVPGTR